jgi:hypothetical protein
MARVLKLVCLGERSGAVLIQISQCAFFDLRSMKIVRHFPNRVLGSCTQKF